MSYESGCSVYFFNTLNQTQSGWAGSRESTVESQQAQPSIKMNAWEGSITMKYRFTFHFEEDIVIFRAIGTYDILLRDAS